MGESQVTNRQNGGVHMEEPSRQKLEEKIANVMSIIQGLEAELKMQTSQSGDSAHNRLREIRAQKEETISEMKKIEDDIQAHNKQIGLQREKLTKCQSNLQYKREDKINEAIRRLEYQLRTQNFRSTEEKKIVQEIDRLKKSKRCLSTYLELRAELDEMRDQQNKLRDRRDALYRKKTVLRTDEDEARNCIAQSGKRIEQLRKDIDELYDQKRKLISDFRQALKDFHTYRQAKQSQVREAKMNKKLSLHVNSTNARTVLPKERQCTVRMRRESFVIEPHKEQITTCNILIKYLQRMGFSVPLTTCSMPDISETDKGCCKVSSDSQMSEILQNPCKFEEETCLTVDRKKKRDKRFKKKYLVLTPDIFEKFDKIGLLPPTIYTDIPCSMEKLLAKKAEYEHLTAAAVSVHSSQAQITTTPTANNVNSAVAKPEIVCDLQVEPERVSNIDGRPLNVCIEKIVRVENVNGVTSTCSLYEFGKPVSLAEDIPSILDPSCALEANAILC